MKRPDLHRCRKPIAERVRHQRTARRSATLVYLTIFKWQCRQLFQEDKQLFATYVVFITTRYFLPCAKRSSWPKSLSCSDSEEYILQIDCIFGYSVTRNYLCQIHIYLLISCRRFYKAINCNQHQKCSPCCESATNYRVKLEFLRWVFKNIKVDYGLPTSRQQYA